MSRIATKSKQNQIDPESEKVTLRMSKKGWDNYNNHDVPKVKQQLTELIKTKAELEGIVEADKEIIDMLTKNMQKKDKEKNEVENKLKVYENCQNNYKQDVPFSFFSDEEINKMAMEASIKTRKLQQERITYFASLCK